MASMNPIGRTYLQQASSHAGRVTEDSLFDGYRHAIAKRSEAPSIDGYIRYNWGPNPKSWPDFVPEDQFPRELQGAPWQLYYLGKQQQE
jgi:hypothetical protein